MLFLKEDLKNLAFDDHDEGVFTSLGNEIVDTTRWSNIYHQIFMFEGKYYKTSYSVGATECQDESPYEYADEEIECMEVFPHIVETTVYRNRPQGPKES